MGKTCSTGRMKHRLLARVWSSAGSFRLQLGEKGKIEERRAEVS